MGRRDCHVQGRIFQSGKGAHLASTGAEAAHPDSGRRTLATRNSARGLAWLGFIGAIENYPAYLEELNAAGKAGGAARFDLVSDMWLLVAEDPDEAFEETAPYYYYQINTYAKWHAETDWGMQPMDFETFKKSGAVRVLTPEAAIDFLRTGSMPRRRWKAFV